MTDVTIPMDLWEGDNEAVITAWLVDDGAQVGVGVLLVEVMVEKTSHEITASDAGVIHIDKAAEAIVKKGDVIATIG